jgi:F0F1-type ATP synthase assembly protein I
LAKSLGVYPWILVVLLLAAFVCAVTGLLRRKSYDARRINSSLRKKLWLDAFTRYCLEIYLRLTH